MRPRRCRCSENTGVPSYLDVNQGYLGDCYFVFRAR